MLDYNPVAVPTRKARKYTTEERQMWRTPNTPDQPVLQLVATALGGEIGLDPTADDAKSVPAYNHITYEQNCLVANWHFPGNPLTAFMNPQFDKPHLYLARLVEMIKRQNIQEAIALLKIGTLSNKKTGKLIKENADSFCCWGSGSPVGRIGFIDHEGYQINGSDFDTVLVYFGKDRYLFKQTFDYYGMVCQVIR
jgi:hypothetical protein